MCYGGGNKLCNEQVCAGLEGDAEGPGSKPEAREGSADDIRSVGTLCCYHSNNLQSHSSLLVAPLLDRGILFT